MNRQTIFSKYRTYRYTLWREWVGGEGYAMFIGLNPSTADEKSDDPTIRRCVAFAKAWGYTALCMTNIFSFRATDPRDMMIQADPVGPDNNKYLLEMSKEAGVIVAAWGTNGTHKGRGAEVISMIERPLHCLGLTKQGYPAHPLYLRKTLAPILLGSGIGEATCKDY